MTQKKNGTETEGVKIEMTDRDEQKFLLKKGPLNDYQWACFVQGGTMLSRRGGVKHC
ncbi:hypothetical protein [Pantoea sp. ME81]|uniref:hypothetical protein n=1 Tax=Pantoea sp. ME81 TaxID=2743935 RepID=UPI0015F3FFCF|nr:hypothetical protein [Pantoea sp. ME81]